MDFLSFPIFVDDYLLSLHAIRASNSDDADDAPDTSLSPNKTRNKYLLESR